MMIRLAWLVGLPLGLGVLGDESARFARIEQLPDRGVAFDFRDPGGGAWRVDSSADMAEWAGLVSFTVTGVLAHVDGGAVYQDRRFYRAVALAAAVPLTGDHLATAQGEAVIRPINHASLVLGWNGRTIYVDPVGGAALYAGLPRADLVLLTHQHSDHLNTGTIESVRAADGVMVAPQAVYGSLSAALKARTVVLANGKSTNLLDLTVEAVPAYNLTTSHHPKGTGNGYVLTLGGKRVYISGDTEDIPEMRALRDIDVAFVSMNQPYTMSLAKAVSAVREFRPKVVYPYHYRNADGSMTDLAAFKQQVGTDLGIEVRLRDWY